MMPSSPPPDNFSSAPAYAPGAGQGPSGPDYGPSYGAGTAGVDWRALLQLGLERGWVVVALGLLGLALAWGQLARSVRLYQSHLVLEVQSQAPSLVDAGLGGGAAGGGGGARLGGGVVGGQEALLTIEQNLRNRALLVRVLRSEGLLGAEGARALLGPPPTTADPATPPAPPPGEEALAGVLAAQTQATIRRGTRLIDLWVVNRDPAMAQRLAEAVGREYIRAAIERRHDFAQEALRFLLEEAERLKGNLQRSEAAVADYKARTPDALTLGGGSTALGGAGGGGGGGGRATAEGRLEELSSKLTAAKAERLRLEGELAQVERAAAARLSTDALLSLPAVAGAPAVADRRREVAQAQAQVAALAQRYKDKHPRMLAARASLEQTQAALAGAAAGAPGLVRAALEQARTTEAGLMGVVHEQEGAALALNRAAIGYQELARQAETDRAMYESVLRQIKSTDLASAANRADAVSVVEHASSPGGPVSPQPAKTLAVGLLGGLGAGLGLVGLLAALDRSVKTVDQAENLFGLPVLAAVPEVAARERRRARRQARRERGRGQADTARGDAEDESDAGDEGEAGAARARATLARAAAAAPEGPVAEAFRSLRAALSLLGPEEDRRVFLFTSALPGEGKSFTSANYALALAGQGHRTLLIDGDLRRPSLHRLFGLGEGGDSGANNNDHHPHSAGGPGVVDYLLAGGGDGGVSLARLVQAVSAPSTGAGGNHHHGRGRGNHQGRGHEANAHPRDGNGTADGDGHSDGDGGLWVLTAGRRAPNPAELLSSGPGQAGLTRLLTEALDPGRGNFARVVIDSAPLLAVSDTLLLLPFAQTTAVVVRARKTARAALARALTILAQAQHQRHQRQQQQQQLPGQAAHHAPGSSPPGVAGLILNRLPRGRGLGYYYHYGGDYQGYNTGTGDHTDGDGKNGGGAGAFHAGRQEEPPVAAGNGVRGTKR